MEPIRQAFAQLIAAHDGELRQQLQHAAAACAQQDFAPAHTVLAPLAAAGEAQAQFILGTFYLYAQGMAQDVHQAIVYWQQAAAQGMALAQTSLGALYAAQGRDDEARGLLAQAAAQGEGYAASALQMFGAQPSAAVQRAIRILREGDADGARRKLEALAREGNVEAIRYLAVMFQRGIGVAQDYAIAREWWGVALALQDDVAQYAMGELYFNGDGVTRDYAQARSYWEQAAVQGNSEAQRGLGVLFRDDAPLGQVAVNISPHGDGSLARITVPDLDGLESALLSRLADWNLCPYLPAINRWREFALDGDIDQKGRAVRIVNGKPVFED